MDRHLPREIALVTDVYDALLEMTAHLIETHMESGEYDGHGGDADHDGEAPEACSYCESIQKSRELLRGLGVDVSAIEPEAGT
jgi:hypothetical protein